ncbi:MAG TPA: hypothetical protein VEC12_11040, partial [Bacteroidia bacterium]|nr:hypothetical protein [Bacteroidia bacterium]
MKLIFFAAAFILLNVPVKGQLKLDETLLPEVVETEKPDSIFWIKDIQLFASENELEILNLPEDSSEGSENTDVFFLGHRNQYMAAFSYSDLFIAIRDKKQYRVWPLHIPEVSQIYTDTQITINKKNYLAVIGEYYFAKHGYNPVLNTYIDCSSSLSLIDLENNEVAFSATISQAKNMSYFWHSVWGFDDNNDLDTAAINPNLTKKQLEAIYIHDTTTGQEYFIDPRGLDTVPMYEDEGISASYLYKIKDNRIELYPAEGGGCKRSENEIKPGTLPEFYYEFIPSKNLWV